jgi:hypothetical protein
MVESAIKVLYKRFIRTKPIIKQYCVNNVVILEVGLLRQIFVLHPKDCTLEIMELWKNTK